MRDYEADAILGENYRRQKTPYQRWRDNQIKENEIWYKASRQTRADIRTFLEKSRLFMEPDVSKRIENVFVEVFVDRE